MELAKLVAVFIIVFTSGCSKEQPVEKPLSKEDVFRLKKECAEFGRRMVEQYVIDDAKEIKETPRSFDTHNVKHYCYYRPKNTCAVLIDMMRYDGSANNGRISLGKESSTMMDAFTGQELRRTDTVLINGKWDNDKFKLERGELAQDMDQYCL